MTLRMSSSISIKLKLQYVRISVKKQNLKGENSQVSVVCVDGSVLKLACYPASSERTVYLKKH